MKESLKKKLRKAVNDFICQITVENTFTKYAKIIEASEKATDKLMEAYQDTPEFEIELIIPKIVNLTKKVKDTNA